MPGLRIGFAGDSGLCDRIAYGSKVDIPYGTKLSVESLYQSLIEPSIELANEAKGDAHAVMLIVTKKQVFYADTVGELSAVRHSSFAIGSGADAARVFMNFQSHFSDPYIFGKVMMQMVSEVCPSVSSHAVVEMV